MEKKCVWLQIFALPLFDYAAIPILVLGICYLGLDVFGNGIKEILIPVYVICGQDIFEKKNETEKKKRKKKRAEQKIEEMKEAKLPAHSWPIFSRPLWYCLKFKSFQLVADFHCSKR